MHTYQVVFTPESGGFVVTVPDIPEVITEGGSMEEATEMAIDAMETVLGEYMRRKMEIPTPSRRRLKGSRLVALSALTSAKLSLYSTMRTGGVRKAELARRLGWSKPQVERLLDLKHGSRMEQIEAAFRALHKRLRIAVEDAA